MLNICIEDMDTVQRFFCYLKQNALSLSLHSDIDFRDLIASGTPVKDLSIHQAMYLNDLLTACYSVCDKFGADIHSVFLSECTTPFYLS